MINAPATPARCQLEVMFVGRHFHNLDAKGRVAVPHKFRSHLGGSNEGRVVITISTNSDFASLDVYPAERWEAKVEEILKTEFPGDDPTAIRESILANYIHPAQEQTLDSQGRLLIPAEHREAAGLTKEIAFTGDMQKFRLWSVDEWRRYDEHTRGDKGKIKSLGNIWL
jgi:MraZ protein